MKQILSLVGLFFLGLLLLPAQVIETIHAPATDKAKMFVNTKKMFTKSLSPALLINPEVVAAQAKWDIVLSQHGINHGSDIPQSLLDSIKQLGRILQQKLMLHDTAADEVAPAAGGLGVTPQIKASYKGNKYNGWAPTDNSIAVSDDGYVVSAVNNSVLFLDETGNILLEEGFGDFMSALNLTGGYFDPRVIYDPIHDKFIFAVMNGNTPATSTLVIGFSSSSNPKDSWWFYTFSGDPTGQNLWMDFPSIGISTDDIYISGNQFTANNTFAQTLIYQLEKGPGFTGGNVNGLHWHGVQDAFGLLDYTITPISFGFNGSIGPGIYFISTDGSGGTDAMLYYTDNNSKNNPQLFVYQVTLPKYYTPFQSHMLGTSDELTTNDCRTLTGFYAEGTIHFAFNNRGGDFHTKINYCRVNTNDLTQKTISIGQTPYDYAFPAIAPFTGSPTDRTVLIGFVRSSGTIYPEYQVIVVDNDMNYSGPVLVKAGESFVNVSTGTLERWGDYSGISRRHVANGAEVWVSGSYGKESESGFLNILVTWIAQVTDGQTGTAPVADFTGAPTTVTAGQTVTFTDKSTNSPTSWAWSFPGGTPANSAVKNPAVTYNTPGYYSVTLVATNNIGNDSKTKAAYITVKPAAQPPVADFSANQTAITAGQSVFFADKSTNSPTTWAWSFPGGMPASATVQNPVVTYNTPGSYSVTLVASNATGNDSETKAAYIAVKPLMQAPVADFGSDVKTISPGGIVSFQDLSTNTPASWQWSFPGGLPNTSNLNNPIIIYPEAGCFDVTLVVANAAGNNSVTKPCFIQVLTTGAEEPQGIFTRFTIYPNPSAGGRLNVEFEIAEPAELKFYVVDSRGIVVRQLIDRRTAAGLTNLAFNTDPLVAGAYYLVVGDERNALLRHEKFMVVK